MKSSLLVDFWAVDVIILFEYIAPSYEHLDSVTREYSPSEEGSLTLTGIKIPRQVPKDLHEGIISAYENMVSEDDEDDSRLAYIKQQIIKHLQDEGRL